MSPDEPDIPLEEFDGVYGRARIRISAQGEGRNVDVDRWLREIVEHIDLIERHTAHGREMFDDPEQPFSDAVEMRIVKLGHAVGELPESVRDALGATQMRACRRMRHRLSRNDRATNLDIVWVAATRDLPALRERVRAYLRQH